MVRHHQRRCSGLCRDARILHIEDSLEDQLSGPKPGKPFDVFPAQWRVELTADPL
jgi:hypothetical protein